MVVSINKNQSKITMPYKLNLSIPVIHHHNEFLTDTEQLLQLTMAIPEQCLARVLAKIDRVGRQNEMNKIHNKSGDAKYCTTRHVLLFFLHPRPASITEITDEYIVL